MWRQICHLEKFLHIRNVETICFVLIYAVLSQNQFVLPFTLFCREINFVAIYAFLHGEKFRQKLCLWRKKDKYQVCLLFLSRNLFCKFLWPFTVLLINTNMGVTLSFYWLGTAFGASSRFTPLSADFLDNLSLYFLYSDYGFLTH